MFRGFLIVDINLITRYYDISSDFNDSISLMVMLLIINKKSELEFHELKDTLSNLEFDDVLLDNLEDVALNIESHDMGRLIRLLSPVDKLFVREKPRDIPSVVTEGRKKIKKKCIRMVKHKKTNKKVFSLFKDIE